MSKRTFVLSGVIAGSVALGMVLGATVFSPGLGLAAMEESNGQVSGVCDGMFGEGPVGAAAAAIGIEPSELLTELRDGRTIAEVAEANGVEPSTVVDAIVADQRERLDQAVQDGVLTQEEADARAAELEERATELVNGGFAPFTMWGRPGLWGFADGPIAAAAEAIGIEPSALLAAVASGQTIMEVAQEHGAEVSAVVDAIVASLQERLDSAVENGWLTQERADELAAQLEDQATAMVNGDLLPFPHPGWRRHGSPMPWFGQDEADAGTAEWSRV